MSKKTKNKAKRVHNLIIVDESGSMQNIQKQAFSGMNETLQTVRRLQAKYPDMEQRVSLVTFNSEQIKWHYDNELAELTKDLDWSDYNPSACTPLYDAMGRAISKVEAQIEEGSKVLATVITDGYENSEVLLLTPEEAVKRSDITNMSRMGPVQKKCFLKYYAVLAEPWIY